jgi:protein-disulfide isomerase
MHPRRGISSVASTLIIGIVLALSLAFLWRVWIYYGDISSGRSVSLPQFSAHFTAVASAASAPVASGDHAEVATADDPSIGPDGAKLTVVEFLDYQCPFCGEESSVLRELTSTYGDRVRFIIRDFPVTSLHPDALSAAEAAGCAQAQGKFWQMHDRLFALHGVLNAAAVTGAAEQAGLDPTAFRSCMDRHDRQAEIEDDAKSGAEAGVRGTPTFFFNGSKVEGVIPIDVFETLIKRFIPS